MASLKFAPFSSEIELPFYHALFASKLDHDKLSDSARPVLGLYEPRPGTEPDNSVKMQILASALTSTHVPVNAVRAEGIIKNTNTLDAFKQVDKNEMLQNAAQQIWAAIKDGTIYSIPSLLSSFILLSYADLKKYRMTYWFGFPALHSDPQWKRTGDVSRRHEARSIILSLTMDPIPDEVETTEMPKFTGWERNPTGKLGPRSVSLAESMDPARLADQSVDLNLKLMKWRISPNLDLDIIKNTKCLLLGAGTLGSYVSRVLLGWGVRKITFVDYGAVSFSNPVRQPLFRFNDCMNGGAPKATRAAESLKEIYPGVDSAGHVLSVPMLGHPITEKTKEDFDTLKALIDSHDAIFLLLDSREARWLPTLMGKAAGKIVMNAALGFDTFVVMRHGAEPTDGTSDTLGCYFCNDVMAPGDSQKDLTLDQQCTVTRPGIAAIASALLVELLTSLLQHPLGAHAPAPATTGSPDSGSEDDHALGIVPHQIRGFLGRFQNLVIKGQSYPNCSACSIPILSSYRHDGWDFIKRALEDKDYVAELSGLAEIQRQAEAMSNDVDWEEEDEEGGGGGGDDEGVLL
ncbi:putative autophagy-related protein 7 protein [Eutypa lata UCREL1]|uniref:Ubiquitin-like modifier-activating enzyme ATG7 n=1 Tax=Eutypa lata (strain UCR-EL1) TaxID=1287681 RepID=M7SIF8_EUTLA|nr:putative autophagy-related protein 7 protein [Eutypa lata UCREL1]